MTWQTICDPAFSGRLCLALAHSWWQVGLLAAAAWAFDRRRPRRWVEGGYVLHVAALLAGLAALPITYALVDAGSLGIAENRTSTEGLSGGTNNMAISGGTDSLAIGVPQAQEGMVLLENPSRGFAAPIGKLSGPPGSVLWPRLAPWILALYAAGVSLMLVRLFRGMWQAQRLASKAQPIGEGALVEMVRAIARKWSMRVVPTLAWAEKIVVPKVVGLVRPTILLPVSAIAGLSANELDLILAHELAHVRRFDLWVNLVQRVAETVLFFNPALWYLSRRIDTLREYCCDELTCRAISGSDAERRTRYASALLRIVELARPQTAAAVDLASLAAGGRSPSELRRRVARLFGEPLAEPVRLSRGGLIALVVMAVVFLAVPSAWHSAAQSAAARTSSALDEKAGEHSTEAVAVTDRGKTDAKPVKAPDKPIDGQSDKQVDMKIVVARHVMLLDGKTIITWADLEKRIAALPDPMAAYPHFYITRGAHEAGLYDSAKKEIWRLHRDYKLKGHGEGSLWADADLRYDRVQTAADLVPDESLRLNGRVVGEKGEPVADAEVLLIAPVDESIPYKTRHVALVQGRVRNPLEDVMTRSDEKGRFALYPPKGVKAYIVAIHPTAGFNLQRIDAVSEKGEIRLLAWAALESRFAEPIGAANPLGEAMPVRREEASLSTQVREKDGFPEVVFDQYWSDMKKVPSADPFHFAHVPPIFETTLMRGFPGEHGTSFSLPGATVSLLPGETRRLDLGPLSDKQQEHLEWLRNESEERSRKLDAESKAASSPAANADKQFEIQVVGPDGKAVPDAAIEIRGDVPLTENEAVRGHFVKKKSYGTEFKTDSDGRLAVRLPKQPERFEVGINLPGFGPYWARWGRPQAIPERFTAELDGAWSVGGVVVDADGSPIQGASVRPSIEYKKRPGDNEQLGVGARTMTDAEGRWRYDSVPESMNEVFAEISHSSYEPLRRPLTRVEFGVRPGQQPAAQIRLERGTTVVGKITDDAGKPIAGALVRTQFLNDIRKAETDDNGEYRLVGCEPKIAKLVATAKGKAMDMKEVRITPDLGPVDFTLKPGGTIRVRVLKTDGQPAANTRIFFQQWRGDRVYFAFDNVNQYADANGVWQWNEAPLEEIKADICPPGEMQIPEQTLVAREEEYVFRAIPALVISGSVVDAETKEPVPSFRVVRGIRGYVEPNARSGRTHVSWVRPESYVATGGRYEVRPDRAEMAHLIRIEADGYRTAVSRDIQSGEGAVQVDFALEKAADIAATVLTPDGRPAAGAKIAVGIAGSQISVTNGEFDGSTYAARCDADDAGRFHFPMPEGPCRLVILHPAGYAYLKSAEKEIAGSIALTAWARVEGTFRVGSKPVGNVPITINSEPVHSYGNDVPNIFTHHDVTCGPDGRFVFERVFPGNGWIGRRLMLTVENGAEHITSSAMMPANFPAGKTAHIDLGGAGLPVVGRLAPPPSFQGQVLWNFALVDAGIDVAEPKMPTPPADVQDDPARREAWWKQWKATPEGQAWQKTRDAADKVRRANPHFTATVARDGSFRIDDVPPGRYMLNVRFSEHSAGQLFGFRFTVLENGEAQRGEPIDLGVLTLQ